MTEWDDRANILIKYYLNTEMFPDDSKAPSSLTIYTHEKNQYAELMFEKEVISEAVSGRPNL